MPHRAKLYRVEIYRRRRPDARCRLGDIDGNGKSAKTAIHDILVGLRAADGSVTVECESTLQNLGACQAGITLFRGNSGINSAIQQSGVTLFQRIQDHTESVRAAILFHLPFDKYEGIAALHVPNNMGYKSILEKTLKAALRPVHTIRISPIVPLVAFERAVRSGHVKKLTLIKRAIAPSDPFLRAAGLGGDELSTASGICPVADSRTARSWPTELPGGGQVFCP